MILSEAVKLVKFHQNMLSEINEYTPEYMADLQDPNSSGSGIKLSQALETILKGEIKHEQRVSKAS